MEHSEQINESVLFDEIKYAVCNIEKELRCVGEGIFFAPELYIAFKIGLHLKNSAEEVFGNSNVIWKREECVLGRNPVDIIFKSEDLKVAIEIKLVDKFKNYKKDINKLIDISKENYTCFFCLLMDENERKDGRTDNLKILDLIILIDKYHFETKEYGYRNPLGCSLMLFKIKPVCMTNPNSFTDDLIASG